MHFAKACLFALLLLSMARAVWTDSITGVDGRGVTAYHYVIDFSQSTGSETYHFYELESPGVLQFKKVVRANKFMPWGGVDSAEWLDACFEVKQVDDYHFDIALKPSCPTCGDFSNSGFLFWSSNKPYYYVIHPRVSCIADYLVLADKKNVGWSAIEKPLGEFVQAKRAQGFTVRVQDVGELAGTDYAGGVRKALSGAFYPSYALIVGDPAGSFPTTNYGDNAFTLDWLNKAPSFGRVPFDGADAAAFLDRLGSATVPRSPSYGIYDSCFGAPEWSPMSTGYCDPNCALCKVTLDVKNRLLGGALSLVASPNACWRPISTTATCDVTLLDPPFGNANLLYVSAHGSEGGKKLATEVRGLSDLGRVAEVVTVNDLADMAVKQGMTVFSTACYGGAMGSPSSTSIAREMLREKKAVAFVGALGVTINKPAAVDDERTDYIALNGLSCPSDCVFVGGAYDKCTCYKEGSIPEGAGESGYAALKSALSGCKALGDAVHSAWRSSLGEGWVLYGDPAVKFSGCS